LIQDTILSEGQKKIPSFLGHSVVVVFLFI